MRYAVILYKFPCFTYHWIYKTPEAAFKKFLSVSDLYSSCKDIRAFICPVTELEVKQFLED